MPINSKDGQRIAQILSGACSKKKICPVKDILATYGDKWSMYTILLLGQHQRMRFSELRTGIQGISQRMLTVTLRSLEEDGIVVRTIYAEVPPKIDYQLTELGESLLMQLLSLASWAEDNFEAIVKSRKQYEKRRVAVGR